MTYETDQRLKSYLDTNQLYREQMCLAVLAVDKRFSDVRPRHPRGGPDGGRDIDAVFRGNQRVFGAVGFVNQANDSDENKKRINDKFKEDLNAALNATPRPEVFVFFTNINLTVGEKQCLTELGKTQGLSHAEILDRERLRIVLDSTDGFSIRFQYLGITLSDAEQASFFARWGDDIQSVISTGFQGIQKSLNRILFLQESWSVLTTFVVRLELKKSYPADEIGHFRAFCELFLKAPSAGILAVRCGVSDISDRMRDDIEEAKKRRIPGIKHGISGGRWELRLPTTLESTGATVGVPTPKYKPAGWSASMGMDPVQFVDIEYRHSSVLDVTPKMALRDLDESSFVLFLNRSFAEKVMCIHVYANSFKLLEISDDQFEIDLPPTEYKTSVDFTQNELADEWVRIMSALPSGLHISFARQTPMRLFVATETETSLPRAAN